MWNAPVADVFLPAAPARRRPHRLRDLAMLALAVLVVAAATQAVADAPSHRPAGPASVPQSSVSAGAR